MDYKLEDVKDYIQLRPLWTIKSDIYTFRGLAIGFGLLSLWVCQAYPWFQSISAASSLVIVIGGWKISTDVERFQKLHIFYLGVTAFLLSVMFFLLSIAIFENMLGFKPINVAIGVGAGYLFVLLGGGYYHIRMVKQGYFSSANPKKAGKTSGKWWVLVPIIPGAMMTFTVVMKSMFGELYLKSTAFAVPLASYLFLCGTVYLHKYYLMKKFEQHVKVHKLDKKSSR